MILTTAEPFAPGQIGEPIVTDEELAEHRADALVRMRSRCIIALPLPRAQWPTGEDGMQTPAHRLLYADLPCRLARDEQSSEATVGDASAEQARRRLDVPHDTRLVDGVLVQIVSGEWVGTFWRLPESVGKDQATALRLVAEEAEEPEGWGTWVSE